MTRALKFGVPTNCKKYTSFGAPQVTDRLVVVSMAGDSMQVSIPRPGVSLSKQNSLMSSKRTDSFHYCHETLKDMLSSSATVHSSVHGLRKQMCHSVWTVSLWTIRTDLNIGSSSYMKSCVHCHKSENNTRREDHGCLPFQASPEKEAWSFASVCSFSDVRCAFPRSRFPVHEWWILLCSTFLSPSQVEIDSVVVSVPSFGRFQISGVFPIINGTSACWYRSAGSKSRTYSKTQLLISLKRYSFIFRVPLVESVHNAPCLVLGFGVVGFGFRRVKWISSPLKFDRLWTVASLLTASCQWKIMRFDNHGHFWLACVSHERCLTYEVGKQSALWSYAKDTDDATTPLHWNT